MVANLHPMQLKRGIRKDFKKKAAKLEDAIEKIVGMHRQSDHRNLDETLQKRESKQVTTMQKHLAKICESKRQHCCPVKEIM